MMEILQCDSDAIILAVEMGYGHLRPAYAIAEAFNTEVTRMDIPPIAGPAEAKAWSAVRNAYHGLSRACDLPGVGPAARKMLGYITQIDPLHNHSSQQPANLLAHIADTIAGTLIGRRFRNIASWEGKPIIATYPVAALAARYVPRARIFCLATDSDLNRAWAPPNAAQAEIDYFAPTEQVAKRLHYFGIPDCRIHITGFPLPADLAQQAETAFLHRLARLNPCSSPYHSFFCESTSSNQPFDSLSTQKPISISLAIGGAGAQTQQLAQILASLRNKVVDGKYALTLFAGIRPKIASILLEMVQCAGLANYLDKNIRILLARDLNEYFHTFNECLANTDVLWTKPGELVFYASLGLPLLLADPVGGQEHANRKWLLSKDAGLDAGAPSEFASRVDHLLATGELYRIAGNAYSRLERNGLTRIIEILNKHTDRRPS